MLKPDIVLLRSFFFEIKRAIEKFCLALYFSCTKFKYYVKHSEVLVTSHFGIIKHMLRKPILNSRIGKWALALTEFSSTYVPFNYSIKEKII